MILRLENMDSVQTRGLEMSYLAWLAYTTELPEISRKIQISNLEGLQNYQVVDILKDASEHFGFVARSKDEIVIAIRGTLSIKDWAYNLLVPRVIDEFHFGFQLYTEPIWRQLQAILPAILTDKVKVFTTGHSLGGASATLLAHKLNNLEFKDWTVRSFLITRLCD
jgi:triacylglycerol lipase